MLVFTLPNNIFAEEIFTTVSHDTDDIVYDGLWSFLFEWKRTSEDKIRYDDGKLMAIKTAHDYENLYVLVDVISDKTPSPMADRGMICIDSKADKTVHADDDDYCFVVRLQESGFFENLFGEMNSEVLQAKASAKTFDELEQIISKEFIGIGTMSDEQDRYSSTPHATYEFKIPTDLVGRSDNYGILFLVFDSYTNSTYSWPENPEFTINEIPSPTKWGNMISPDKSLPEFNIPMLIILSSIVTITIISRLKLSHISR